MYSELIFPGVSKRGDSGSAVRKIQEWLCFNNFNIAIDGQFGPATEQVLKRFQHLKNLPMDGVAGESIWQALTVPMQNVLNPLLVNGCTLSELIVRYAQKHLAVLPREVGGQNRGPWVRLYMDGNEGEDWPWCAGFVSFVLKQACNALTIPMPINSSFACQVLAQEAHDKKLLYSGAKTPFEKILPGSIFIIHHGCNYVHTGIVISSYQDTFTTIEGNTNDDGSAEGYEVCFRTRSYTDKEFIIWG